MANALIYGFENLKDLANTRAIELDPDLIISAIGMSQQQHDAEVNAILDLFSVEGTEPQRQFKGSTVTRNQPLTHNGVPIPIKPPAPYTVGFPIEDSGNAWGANFVTNAKMTVQQVSDNIATLYYGDFAWLRDHVLAAIFDNAGYSWPDPQYGNLPVKGLANGDAVTYGISTNGADSLATDTHYLAQANAIDNSNNPFPTIYTELTEHPENGTDVISFINSAQYSAVAALTNFVAVADPRVEPAQTAARLVGTLGSQLPARAVVVGLVDRNWIVQWNAIPSTYVVSVAVGGTPPLIRRVDAEPELQGFRPQGPNNGRIEIFPFFQENWIRRMGFGGWNRVGAVVTRTGNGTYAVPTNYGAPMA